MTSNALEPQASTAPPLTTVMVVVSGWSLVAIKIRLAAVATTVLAVPYLGVDAGQSMVLLGPRRRPDRTRRRASEARGA